MKSSTGIHNILIIKPGAIGDVLQLTPVIRALRSNYRDAQITLLVGSSATAALFQYNPSVTETIIFDKHSGQKSFASLLKLWRRLRLKKFDLVLNFQRSNLKTWFLTTAALPCRILIYHKARKRTVHAVVNYLETMAPLGIFTSDLTLELSTGPDDKRFAEHLIVGLCKPRQPLVALNPGASHPIKQWTSGQFAALADMLVEKLSARVVIIGGKEDMPLAKKIVSQTRTKPLSVAGKTSLLQLGAVLEKCTVLVSGDTGPMHLGTAVGTSVVALFGATDPQRTGPVGSGHTVLQAKDVPCVPCKSLTCRNAVYLECMKNISVETVFRAIVETIKNS
jgi:ADP-heptose:LPS heptosyltransferase